MTITSLPPAPVAVVPSAAPAGGGQPGSAAAALFGQLVGQHLDAAAPSAGAGETLPVVPPADPAIVALAAGIPSAPVPVRPVPTPTAPGSVPVLVPVAVDETDDPAGTGADPASGAPATTAPDAAASGGLAGFPVVALLVASTTATPSPAEQSTQVGSVPGSSSPKADAPGTPGPVLEEAATAPTASAPTATAPDPTSAGLTPVTGPTTGTTPATDTTTTTAATRSAVLDQVLPTVPRIVLRGDGTSQLTLKLHPADLGEVHVTVTVRGREVDVTLSAGAQAREALTEGSSRLRSLLEGIGHTAGQVVVRDLVSTPAPPTTASPSTGSPTGGPAGGEAFGQSQERTSGQGGRPGSELGDPSSRGHRSGDQSPHLHPPGTRRHQPSDLSGVDVTI